MGNQRLRILAKEKLEKDFENSHLHAPSANAADQTETLRILKAAKILRPSRTKFFNSRPLFRTPSYGGIAPPDLIQAVRKHGRLSIQTSSVAAASVAVLKSLASREELKLDVDFIFHDVNGRDQMRALGNFENPPDFLVAPDGAFFFNGGDIQNQYQVLMGCFYEDQCILRRADAVNSRGGKLFVFPESAAETMYASWSSWGRLKKMARIDREAAELPHVARALERPDRLIAWEPLASSLLQQSEVWERRERLPKLEREPKSWFPVTFSFMAHERWTHPDSLPFALAFEELFVAEWNNLRLRKEYAWDLLKNDMAFLRWFGMGAGIDVVSIPEFRDAGRTEVAAALIRREPIQLDHRNRLRRRGQGLWEIQFNGQEPVTIKDSVGVEYIAILLASSGTEFSCSDLGAKLGRAVVTGQLRNTNTPALDPESKLSYRAKLEKLTEEISVAESQGRADAVELREEAAAIREKLSAAHDGHGNDKTPVDDGQRHRKSVCNAIGRAIQSLQARPETREVGRHFGTQIRRGFNCSYPAEAEKGVRWFVEH